MVETVFDRSNTSLKSFIFLCSQDGRRLYFHFTLKTLTSYVFVVIKIVLDMLDRPNKDCQRFRYSQEVRLRTVVSFKIKTQLVFLVAKLRCPALARSNKNREPFYVKYALSLVLLF